MDTAAELHRRYLPNTLVVYSETESEAPLFKSRFVQGETYIYVCQNNSCKLPTSSVETALGMLDHF